MTRLVIIESPYAGDVERNVAYARACLADSLARGEAPIASHLLYTQPGVLDDLVPEERAKGIAAGLAWGRVADLVAFYVDLGWSPGMEQAHRQHVHQRPAIQIRRIGDAWDKAPPVAMQEGLLRHSHPLMRGCLAPIQRYRYQPPSNSAASAAILSDEPRPDLVLLGYDEGYSK